MYFKNFFLYLRTLVSMGMIINVVVITQIDSRKYASYIHAVARGGGQGGERERVEEKEGAVVPFAGLVN